MTFLRGLWIDLVDKRLWPLAAGLVVALVAVPVVLHRSASGSGAGVPAPALAAPTRDAGALPAPVVSISTDKPRGVLVGTLHNPFRPQHVPRPAAPATSTSSAPTASASTASSTSGSSTSSSGSGGGASAPTTTPVSSPPTQTGGGSKPHTPTHRQPHVKQTYVKVRFGRFGDGLHSLQVGALKALPPKLHPFLVYLGRARNGRTAVFAVSPMAQPATRQSGGASDGVCRPLRSECHTIHLNPGDRVDFAVSATKGTAVTDYRLIVTGYTRR